MAELLTGRIYIIRSPNTDKVYVGSTTMSLKRRFQIHLCDWRNDIKTSSNSYLILDKSDAYIELLEEIQVENKREIEMLEQKWLDRIPNTVNTYKAYISEEEKKENRKIYYETHKQELLEQRKKYYETHKQELLEQQKIYRDTHKQEMSEYQKTYRDKNKEKRNEKRRGKIHCEICDCLISIASKSVHERTKKHIRNLENVTPS